MRGSPAQPTKMKVKQLMKSARSFFMASFSFRLLADFFESAEAGFDFSQAELPV